MGGAVADTQQSPHLILVSLLVAQKLLHTYLFTLCSCVCLHASVHMGVRGGMWSWLFSSTMWVPNTALRCALGRCLHSLTHLGDLIHYILQYTFPLTQPRNLNLRGMTKHIKMLNATTDSGTSKTSISEGPIKNMTVAWCYGSTCL